MTVCDLPLHTINNEQVLAALSQTHTVKSEVFYGTVWHEGLLTSIHNGDRYFYVSEETAAALPEKIEIGRVFGRIFKLVALSCCWYCQEVGHKAFDKTCPALALDGMQDNLELVHGGKHLLSNLHNCPEGCEIKDGHYDYSSSEQHYQFGQLHSHSKDDVAFHVLEAD